MHANIVIAVLNDKDGKDKSLKIIQYTCKLILITVYRGHKGPRPINAIISEFSQFRKIIRLGNWLSICKRISEHKKITSIDCIDFYNEIFDDIYCLSRMNVLPSNIARGADMHANYGWFLSIMYNLREEWYKYEKTNNLNTSVIMKLLMDMVFCGIDVFELKFRHSKDIQTVAGLISGLLSYSRLYDKTYDGDFKAVEERKSKTTIEKIEYKEKNRALDQTSR